MRSKKLWGLIGNSKIGEYSVAPKMWNELFRLKDIPIKYFILGGDISSDISSELQKYLKDPNFIGANIALPWKYLGYEFCEHVEDSASHMDAINTLIKKGSRIEGYNTDGIGIINTILKNINPTEKTVLLIGCGSSSQTVPSHLIKNRVKKIYVTDIIESRAKRVVRKYSCKGRDSGIDVISIGKKELSKIISEVDILINMTPCGMTGFKEKYPIEKTYLDKLKKDCLLVEAIYTPYETPLLEYVKEKGNRICPGVDMLVEQAAESFYLAFKERLTEKEKEFMKKIAINELSEKRKTILITGASGFIGEYLSEKFSNKFDVIGIDIKENHSKFFKKFYKTNICDKHKIAQIFKENKVSYVIHSAAGKHLVWCEEHRDEAYSLNFLATKNLYKISKTNNAKFIFISSDQVFDGKESNYSENSVKHPINHYGTLKDLSEEFLINDPKVAICRTAMVFGKIPKNQKDFFNKIKNENHLIIQGYIVDHVIHKLKSNKKIILPKDEFCNPTSNSLLFRQIERVIKDDLYGILHCCGGERINRYDFGREIAKIFNLQEEFIDPISSNDELRPKDVSMTTLKTSNLMNTKFPKLNEMILEEWNLA